MVILKSGNTNFNVKVDNLFYNYKFNYKKIDVSVHQPYIYAEIIGLWSPNVSKVFTSLHTNLLLFGNGPTGS